MNIIYIFNFQIYKNLTDIKTTGGIETVANHISKELKNRGHNIWKTHEKKKPEWVKKGLVDIIIAPSFDPLTYLHILKFKKKFKNRAAVVIHGQTTIEDLAGNFLPNKPIFNKILKLWLRIIYGTAHLLITPSEYSKKSIENIQKSMTYPIYAVSSGIEIEKFKNKQEYKGNFRNYLYKKYEVPLNATIIINVGLSWKKKGVGTFSEIAKAFPKYYFIWVGPINKNPEIDEALKLSNVIFTGFYEDIREPYYGADVFLSTSFVETLCLPLIEASLCKIPIVTRNLPAYDWLENDQSCCKADDTGDFIRGIEKMLSDSNFRTKITENAYKKAVKLHDSRNTVSKFELLFKHALLIKKIRDRKRKK
ncbi:MAG: glycosyltransferase family 4 protein [Promethearchaeota archaeon]